MHTSNKISRSDKLALDLISPSEPDTRDIGTELRAILGQEEKREDRKEERGT